MSTIIVITPKPGNTVLYTLSESDAQEINRQSRGGNRAHAGDVLPMIVIRNWDPGGSNLVNGQVLLDGSDTYWATSRGPAHESVPGSWHWPVQD